MTRDDINLQLLEHLFPKKFMVEVMIPTMNKSLKTSVSFGELLSWRVCRFLCQQLMDLTGAGFGPPRTQTCRRLTSLVS